ncbi:type VI secretion system protein TssA [Granulicella sp. L60]|uniref:type VI secretion system protein TssA n=1 Tax=Granulicella sp. L60 TaxID=1641866 RepID=UPI00131CE3CC|nr:type VI secretion system protein TssA [Granulicella sp. L60]
MPLRQNLLTPIAGDNPAGVNLRYETVYDQIKEARTEEDETLPTGAWDRPVKRADLNLVIKLASEALVNKSKDLQLAVWLGEAVCRQEGVSVLPSVLRLCLELQERFWDTLYPELDDGDAGLRVAPLQWASKSYTTVVYGFGLTSGAIDFFDFKAARAAGTEEEAGGSEQRRALRQEAVAQGKPTSEEVDDSIAATPKVFYVELEQELHSARDTLRELEIFCEEHYVEDGPSFRQLREALEEVHNLSSSLLREKRRQDPDAVKDQVGNDIESRSDLLHEEDHAELPPVSADVVKDEGPAQTRPALASGQPLPKANSQTITPESWSDALSRIESAVGYMYEQDPSSRVPFLVRSSMRIGELLAICEDLRHEDLVAPSTELRWSIKNAIDSGNWREVHRQSFEALGTSCGRAWLDLYRYLWTSCHEEGWEAQQRSIFSVVSRTLREIPEFPQWTLNDDTPVGNADTLRWLREEITSPAVTPGRDDIEVATVLAAAPVPAAEQEVGTASSNSPDEENLFVAAQALTANGQIKGAIQMLAHDAAQQSVGRLRYSRKLQIAELCMQSGNKAVAIPVLQSLIREVEQRQLESWEPRETIARPYALLLQCSPMDKLDAQSIFARLCAIDPSAALAFTPPVERGESK